MKTLLRRALVPLLMRLDPETAHGLALRALSLGLVSAPHLVRDSRLAVKVAGLSLPNPLGMAAGFDKNAEVANAVLALGFGFVEVGTVTPRPQSGNARPRIFRLPADGAIINRLGFNNEGHQVVLSRLQGRPRRAGIVGVNIGANKDSADRIADYAAGVRLFAPVADYMTVNISSPNTPGLRDLQAGDSLPDLLKAVTGARDAASSISGKRLPVFLKVAPDLDEAGIAIVSENALAHALDGIVLTNTTLARSRLGDTALSGQTGGLSGKPLFERSTSVLARFRRAVGADMALIGVGGVDGAQAVLAKIAAGADCVQLYTAFIYQGPDLAARILSELVEKMESDGVTDIAAYRDTAVDAWAARPLAD